MPHQQGTNKETHSSVYLTASSNYMSDKGYKGAVLLRHCPLIVEFSGNGEPSEQKRINKSAGGGTEGVWREERTKKEESLMEQDLIASSHVYLMQFFGGTKDFPAGAWLCSASVNRRQQKKATR
ncbi:hypothetical protein HNY73_009754 [Argiope bruennichi]|uniref:Uncharacterized protein n=1 Tax=Argiope bruennichi TaxID=94029 RepID=A0A8T0FH77_ARGBR|nr:hypothetical protein HNY73_009754 [Argiope bruennichi]